MDEIIVIIKDSHIINRHLHFINTSFIIIYILVCKGAGYVGIIDMNTQNTNELHINEIRKAYKKIDDDWLTLHYKISIGLFLFSFFVECFMAFIMINSELLTSTVNGYLFKYIIAPCLFNLMGIVIDTIVIKSKRFNQNQKIYTVSLVLVLICFVLFTAHNSFTATYYLFVFAIILTTIYASYKVTGITVLTSMIALVLSELFIQWDPDKPSLYESTQRLGEFLISISIMSACSVICIIVIHYEQKKNEASIQKELERLMLEHRLNSDELTGVYSRKALHDAMRDLEANDQENYILAITDIDNFKSVNDQLGHHIGDECLVEFTTILKEYGIKASIYRYGGDEFCLLFYNADLSEAVSTCEEIREKLDNLFRMKYVMLNLTVSFGLAKYHNELNAARLFINADQALYEAKETRNCVRVY